MAVYYVNWQTGDDGQDGDAATHTSGTNGPKKHINAVMALLTSPITEEIIINVAGDVANPGDYVYQDATDDALDLTMLNMTDPSAALRLMLTGFDQIKYQGGEEAPDGGASWAAGGTKPATIPPIVLGDGNTITVVGLRVTNPDSTAPAVFMRGGWVALIYARVADSFAGVRVMDGAVYAENSAVYGNTYGIFAESGGAAVLVGRNVIADNLRCGLRAREFSAVMLSAWPVLPGKKYQTTISTSSARGVYAAVALEEEASMIVKNTCTDGEKGGEDKPFEAELQIIDASLSRSAKSFGVLLKSGAKFIGAGNVRFNDAAVNDGKDTVPAERQFVQGSGQGTLLID